MNKERLKEICEWRNDDWFVDNPNRSDVNFAIDELLIHIDALQAEVARLKTLVEVMRADACFCDNLYEDQCSYCNLAKGEYVPGAD